MTLSRHVPDLNLLLTLCTTSSLNIIHTPIEEDRPRRKIRNGGWGRWERRERERGTCRGGGSSSQLKLAMTVLLGVGTKPLL